MRSARKDIDICDADRVIDSIIMRRLHSQALCVFSLSSKTHNGYDTHCWDMCLCGGQKSPQLVNKCKWEEDVPFKEPNQISLLIRINERS